MGIEKTWRECGECEGEGIVDVECLDGFECELSCHGHGVAECYNCKGERGFWVDTRDIEEFGKDFIEMKNLDDRMLDMNR